MAGIRIQANGKEKKRSGKNLSFLFNGKRSSTVAEKHKPRKKAKQGKRPKHNPHRGTNRGKPHAKHPGRNPLGERGMSIAQDVATVAGAVAASVIPEIIEDKFLVSWNSGFTGYLADAVLGGVITWGGTMLLPAQYKKAFRSGGIAGIAVKVSIRGLQDMALGNNAPGAHNAIAAAVRNQQAQIAQNTSGSGGGSGQNQLPAGQGTNGQSAAMSRYRTGVNVRPIRRRA